MSTFDLVWHRRLSGGAGEPRPWFTRLSITIDRSCIISYEPCSGLALRIYTTGVANGLLHSRAVIVVTTVPETKTR